MIQASPAEVQSAREDPKRKFLLDMRFKIQSRIWLQYRAQGYFVLSHNIEHDEVPVPYGRKRTTRVHKSRTDATTGISVQYSQESILFYIREVVANNS